jgi:tetratricopeptide (TPR) repeat protein
VVIGTIGSQQRSEQLASGSSVNIAARLAAAAAPGTVMISEATARRASGLFAMTALGAQSLKGLAAPVTAFRPTAQHGPRSRLAAWGAGSGRPLVGRDVALADLLSAWAQVGARQSEPAALVLMRGEAGIGKSRLVQALRQRLAGEPHGWIACHGTAMQQGRDFFPIVEAIRASLDLEGGEPEAVARARLEAALAAVGIGAGPGTAHLAVLLGLASHAAELTAADRRLAIAAIIDWWLRLARQTPLVLALEDLHWFDPSSLELIGQLLASAGDAPILVVGTQRPEWQSPWPAHVIDLPPLASSQSGAIIAAILGDVATPGVVAALVERADGVPLFAEELAQAWLDQVKLGGEGGVPASLRDSMTARLDRLGASKRLVQLGALLGRSFSHELIAAVSELEEAFLLPGLAEIVGSGILQRSGVPPRATYSFRHALLQDAAADSLLRQQYRRDNAGIAAMLRDRFPTLADGDPGRVAQHFAEAGCVSDAILWYRRAGVLARRRAAYREAEAAYHRAIALAEAQATAGVDDDLTSELYAELAPVLQFTHGYAAPQTVEAILRGQKSGKTVHDEETLPQDRELFQAMLTRGAYAEAMDFLATVLAAWQGDSDCPDLIFFRLGAHIQTAYFTGDLAGVERSFLQLAHRIDRHDVAQPTGTIISAFGIAGLAAWWRGDAPLAWQRMEEARAFAETTGDSYDQAKTLHYLSQLHTVAGDEAGAAQVGERLLAFATANGFSYLAALVHGPIGWSAARQGRSSGNAAVIRSMIDAQIAAGARIAVPRQLNLLAEVEYMEGNSAAALAVIEEALTFNPEERLYIPESLYWRAIIRAEAEPTAARDDLEEALRLARLQGGHGVALHIANTLAAHLMKTGATAEAEAVLMSIVMPPVERRHPADEQARRALLARLQPRALAVTQ